MLLTAQPQQLRPIVTTKQLRVGRSKIIRTIRGKGVCRAHEVAGDAYEDIVDQLAQRVLDLHRHRQTATFSQTPGPTSASAPSRLVVGIAGAPGSGKSTLAAAVVERLNQFWVGGAADIYLTSDANPGPGTAAAEVRRQGCGGGDGPGAAPFAAVMPMDGFHYYRQELDAMPDPAEAHARRGAPWTFNAAKFVDSVRSVRLAGPVASAAGAAEVWLPSFDHGVGDPVEEDIRVAAETAVVVVEGNYLLLEQEPWCRLRELFDETWFVSCPLDLIRQRLFDRQTGIGLAAEVSLERIRTNDLPNAELVMASEGAANVRVPGWVPPKRLSQRQGQEAGQERRQGSGAVGVAAAS